MAQYQAFDKEEIDFINSVREKNDKTEEFFLNSRQKWDNEIQPLLEQIKCDFNTLDNARKVMDVQATALAYRQNLYEQISFYLNKRSKESVKLKKIKQDKFLWYALNFGAKTNMGEKSILIDAHTAEMERTIEIIDVHIDFLRLCSKNLSDLGYNIKNIIELYNYLSKN